jgi:hypothetical protein
MKRLSYRFYQFAQEARRKLGVRLFVIEDEVDYIVGNTDEKPDTSSVLVVGQRSKFVKFIESQAEAAKLAADDVPIEKAADGSLTVRLAGYKTRFYFADDVEEYLSTFSNPRAFDPYKQILYTAEDMAENDPEPLEVTVDGKPWQQCEADAHASPVAIREAVTKRFLADPKRRGAGVFQLAHDGGDSWFVKVEATDRIADSPAPAKPKNLIARWYGSSKLVTFPAPADPKDEAKAAVEALRAAGVEQYKDGGYFKDTVFVADEGQNVFSSAARTYATHSGATAGTVTYAGRWIDTTNWVQFDVPAGESITKHAVAALARAKYKPAKDGKSFQKVYVKRAGENSGQFLDTDGL